MIKYITVFSLILIAYSNVLALDSEKSNRNKRPAEQRAIKLIDDTLPTEQRAVKIIKATLKKGSTVNIIVPNLISNHERDSLLHAAIYYKKLNLFKQLMEKNADITVRDEQGRTPLNFAAIFNRYQMVEILLKAGSDPNAKDFSQQTALHRLAQHGGKESAKLLLTYGADINALDNDGKTPFEQHYDFFGHISDNITSVLVKHDFQSILRKHSGYSILKRSIAMKDFEAVAEILKHKPALSVEEFNKCLDNACKDAAIIKLVAPYGNKIPGDIKNIHYPLFKAVLETNDVKAAALLIELGADVQKAVLQINSHINSSIDVSLTNTPEKIAKSLIRPLKKYNSRIKRNKMTDGFLSSFFSALPYMLLAVANILFIFIPTFYLCTERSWLYLLIPGIPIGLMCFLILPSIGPGSGMFIVVVIQTGLALDAFLMLLMPILAIWKYATRKTRGKSEKKLGSQTRFEDRKNLY